MNIRTLFIVFVISILIYSQVQVLSQTQTQINYLQQKDEDEQFKKERQLWIENMHRIEPGVNWRLIDNETRRMKADHRQKYMLSKNNNHPNILDENEIIADGLIKGSWIERGSNNCAGRIHTADIDFSRNLIYAASAGGNIWRGTIDGTGWQCLNNSFNISNIRMVRVIKIGLINRIIVVGNGSHVYYSDDEGLLWNDSKGLENLQKWGGIKRAVITGTSMNEIYILCNEWDYEKWKSITSLYKSNDNGENFIKIYEGSVNVDLCDIWGDKYTNNIVYFVHKDTLSSIDIYNVADKIGLIVLDTNTTGVGRVYLKGNNYNNNKHFVLFVMDKSTYKYKVYRSENNGQNWEFRGNLNFSPFEHNSMAVSITNPDVMYFGGVELFRSFDGGNVWQKRNNWWDYYGSIEDKLHADIPGIDVFKDPLAEADVTLISTDGGLYISSDNTGSVLNLSLFGLNVSQYYSTYTERLNFNKIYAGSQDQGLQRCLLDSGKTLSFQQVISGDYGHLSSSDGGKTLWSVYPGFAQVYTDFDKSDTKRISWDFDYNNHLWMPPLVEDPKNPQSIYIAAGGKDDEQELCHLTYDGKKINANYLDYNFNSNNTNGTLSAIAYSPIDNNYFYSMTDKGKFFYSTDACSTWTENVQFDGPNAHYFYGSCIVPSYKTLGKLYIAGSGYSNPGVYVSYDNGLNFTPIDSGLPNTMVYEIAVSPDDEFIFAATEAGPYVYVTSRNSWFDMSGLNAPDQTYWSVEYIPEIKTARFGTYGRGIWDFKISEITNIEDKINVSQKLNVSVYPNPVYPNTNIIVESPFENDCTIKILSEDGKFVKHVYNGIIKQGTNSFYWNGYSDSGKKLPAGLYLCIANSMGISNFCKIILE